MQPAVSIPWRAAFAVATFCVLVGAVAMRDEPRVAIPVVPPSPSVDVTIRTASVVAETLDDYLEADRLARAVEERRYRDIDRALAAIDPHSRYAPWVPAALGLAVEQIDATTAAYARMGMCSELQRFVTQLEQDWPSGAAARKRVYCGKWISYDAIRNAGGIDAYRRIVTENAEPARRALEVGLTASVLAEDHATALAQCREMQLVGELARFAHDDGDWIDPECAAEACRGGELAIAEVLLPFANRAAVEACERAGVNFSGGRAWTTIGLRTASSLVRVHPDAPIRHEPISIDY